VDKVLGALQPGSNWPFDFERKRREIIELWDACNVPLVHRTYFFLLFKGEPSDAVYMEVELRRLSFLKVTFSRGSSIMKERRTLTPASRYSLSLPCEGTHLRHKHKHTHALEVPNLPCYRPKDSKYSLLQVYYHKVVDFDIMSSTSTMMKLT
jgi:hypothetical protein